MTRFVLQEALGSETHYNNLIHGTLAPDLLNTNDTTLKLLDDNLSAVTISGQNFQYSFNPPGIVGGTVLSISVSNSASVALLTIDQFPANSPAATFFQNFVGGGVASLFTTLNSGNDLFAGNSFANTLNGGNGRDRISGGAGTDRLNGGNGVDTLLGGAHNDTLVGGASGDSLNGGSGNDSLFGGTGNDKMTGDIGFDSFVFRAGDGMDTITDFKANSGDALHMLQDHIVVTQVLKDHFEKHLVRDGVTNAILGVEIDFFDAAHVAKGSIFLQNVLSLGAITGTDFIVG